MGRSGAVKMPLKSVAVKKAIENDDCFSFSKKMGHPDLRVVNGKNTYIWMTLANCAIDNDSSKVLTYILNAYKLKEHSDALYGRAFSAYERPSVLDVLFQSYLKKNRRPVVEVLFDNADFDGKYFEAPSDSSAFSLAQPPAT
jgi:hypothetical protein